VIYQEVKDLTITTYYTNRLTWWYLYHWYRDCNWKSKRNSNINIRKQGLKGVLQFGVHHFHMCCDFAYLTGLEVCLSQIQICCSKSITPQMLHDMDTLFFHMFH